MVCDQQFLRSQSDSEHLALCMCLDTLQLHSYPMEPTLSPAGPDPCLFGCVCTVFLLSGALRSAVQQVSRQRPDAALVLSRRYWFSLSTEPACSAPQCIEVSSGTVLHSGWICAMPHQSPDWVQSGVNSPNSIAKPLKSIWTLLPSSPGSTA